MVGSVTRGADPASLTASCPDGDRAAAALGELARSGVRVSGFSLDQPSLDEVFHALTGHRATTADNDNHDDTDAPNDREHAA